MPIYAPDRRINPTIRRKGGGGRRSVAAGLYLTSMVDMFAMLVIFLLQSFSAEGEIIVLPKGLELPEAANTGTLERAAVITVSREKVEFQGKQVAETSLVADQAEWVVPALQDVLKEYKAKVEAEFQADLASGKIVVADPANPPKAEVKINISADRRLQFQVVKKIMYNASFAGFPDFRFAVFGKHKDGEPTPQ